MSEPVVDAVTQEAPPAGAQPEEPKPRTPSLRVISYDGQNWVDRGDVDAAEAKRIEEAESLTWIRVERADEATLADLQQAFNLHPLTVSDIQDEGRPPKAMDLKDVSFFLAGMPDFKIGDYSVDWEQVGVYLAHDHVITVSSETIQPLDDVANRLLEVGLAEDDASLSHLFYWIADALAEGWFGVITAMEKDLEQLEDDVLESADQEELDRIRHIKKLVTSTYRKSLTFRDAISQLLRPGMPNIDDRTNLYLTHVADKGNRIVDRLEHTRELALTCQDTWNASLANEQNTLMKRLTVGAALLLLPGLLAGIGGMNWADFPADLIGFWWFTGGLFALMVGGFWYAWKKRMF